MSLSQFLIKENINYLFANKFYIKSNLLEINSVISCDNSKAISSIRVKNNIFKNFISANNISFIRKSFNKISLFKFQLVKSKISSKFNCKNLYWSLSKFNKKLSYFLIIASIKGGYRCYLSSGLFGFLPKIQGTFLLKGFIKNLNYYCSKICSKKSTLLLKPFYDNNNFIKFFFHSIKIFFIYKYLKYRFNKLLFKKRKKIKINLILYTFFFKKSNQKN